MTTQRPGRWRPLRPVALVLAMLISIDLLVRMTSPMWEKHSPDDYAARVEGCRREPRDLIFLGGSPVSEGINPDVFQGLSWHEQVLENPYAIGLPGGTTSDFFHAIQTAGQIPPRVLVYGITASDLNDNRNEPHGPASLMTPWDVITWARQRPDARSWVIRTYLKEKLARSWSLYRHRHGIRMWATLQAEDMIGGLDPAVVQEARELRDYARALREGRGYAPAAGFVERRYDAVKAAGAPLPPFSFLNRYRTGSHLTYLHRLRDWCREHDVHLVLVDMPVTADLEQQYPEAFAEYWSVLRTFEEETGTPVIRAHRDVVGIVEAGFADTIHLNGVGARVLSLWVRNQLEEVGRDWASPESGVVQARAQGDAP